MDVQCYVLVLVAAMSLVCLGQEELTPETVPSCDRHKFTFVDPDLEKLEGKWFKKYASHTLYTSPVDGVEINWGYTPNAGVFSSVKLTLAITRVVNKEDDCLPDDYWSCILRGDGKCENNGHGSDFLAILAIDYNSTVGSFITWAELTASNGLQYPMVSIYVKDPFNFPTLEDVIARSKLKDFCDPGADDPSSDFYRVAYPYENFPDCLLPA